MDIEPLHFITGNAGKAKEYTAILGDAVTIIPLDLPEIQSLASEDIVSHKLKQAYEIVKAPVIVEDVSLVFQAIEPLPGPFVKWFLEALHPDGITRLVATYENQHAHATCTIGLFDGDTYTFFTGKITGDISRTPQGSNGFGWDSIFIPSGYTKTYAQMDMEIKNTVSHRSLAIAKLKDYIALKDHM